MIVDRGISSRIGLARGDVPHHHRRGMHRVQVTHGVLARSEHEPLVNGVPKRGERVPFAVPRTVANGCRKLWDRGDERNGSFRSIAEGVMSVTRSVWRFSENACSSWKLRWMLIVLLQNAKSPGRVPRLFTESCD